MKFHMKEPLSLRINDETNPNRSEHFRRVLGARGAKPSEVIRHLIDSYIDSGGKIAFPATLIEKEVRKAK